MENPHESSDGVACQWRETLGESRFRAKPSQRFARRSGPDRKQVRLRRRSLRRLHGPHRQAFLDQGAMQCGYCTPGMIMSGVALLAKNTNPTSADIVRSMDGNICR